MATLAFSFQKEKEKEKEEKIAWMAWRDVPADDLFLPLRRVQSTSGDDVTSQSLLAVTVASALANWQTLHWFWKKRRKFILKKIHQKLSVRRVRQDFGQIIGSHSLLLRRRIQSLLKGKTIADLLRHICIFIGGRQHPNSVSRNEWIVKRELFTDAIPPQRQRPPKKDEASNNSLSQLAAL